MPEGRGICACGEMTANPQTAVPAAFEKAYGQPPQVMGRAPGRANLIGEHTDYNEGYVLPIALDRVTCVAAAPRDDSLVRVHSLDYNVDVQFSLDDLRAPGQHEATLYPRGVLWILREEGYTPRGLDLAIGSDVPNGAGLSSSAAMELAMLEVATALFDIPMTQTAKALLGVQIEHRFVGVRTGMMDQMISALGQADHALLIDCRTLQVTPVPLPPDVSLLILDTGKRRELSNTEYGLRRTQCERAAQLLGVRALRDVTVKQLEEAAAFLPEVIYKRAMHVVQEDVRTLATVEALRANDMPTVGRLLNEGHASLRDLFEISIYELDVMAELAQHAPGCYGARMMGGGFGGAVIALAPNDKAESIAAQVADGYRSQTGLEAIIYLGHAGPGSGLVIESGQDGQGGQADQGGD